MLVVKNLKTTLQTREALKPPHAEKYEILHYGSQKNTGDSRKSKIQEPELMPKAEPSRWKKTASRSSIKAICGENVAKKLSPRKRNGHHRTNSSKQMSKPEAPVNVEPATTTASMGVAEPNERSRAMLSKIRQKLNRSTTNIDRQQPYDNFNRWDARQPVAQASLFLAFKRINLRFDEQDREESGSNGQGDKEAGLPAISKIDWSQFEDAEKLKELIEAYNPASPADSGVDLRASGSYEDVVHYPGPDKVIDLVLRQTRTGLSGIQEGPLQQVEHENIEPISRSALLDRDETITVTNASNLSADVVGDDLEEARSEQAGHQVPIHTARDKGKGRAVDHTEYVSRLQRGEVLNSFEEIRQQEEQLEGEGEHLADKTRAVQRQKEDLHIRKLQQYQEAVRHSEEERRAHEEAERQEAERQRLARLRDCICCGDTKDIHSDFPILAPTPQCEHLTQTCTECMQIWLSSEISSNGTVNLRCPECPHLLSHEDVQRNASASTFETYEKLITRAALSVLPDFAWCLSPAGCTSGQLNEESPNFMLCTSCGYKQCTQHLVPWHTGETCSQYEYRTSGAKARDEEKASNEMAERISKKCPGPNCGWRIEKTEGCDHMTCFKCRWEFCWECLASHREVKRVGNTAHASDCSFHSDNIRVAWPFNAHL